VTRSERAVAAQVNWAALRDERCSLVCCRRHCGSEVSQGSPFRVDGLLAGAREPAASAEVNIGIAPSALVGAGDARFAMLSYAELRVPLPTLFFIMLAYSLRSSACRWYRCSRRYRSVRCCACRGAPGANGRRIADYSAGMSRSRMCLLRVAV